VTPGYLIIVNNRLQSQHKSWLVSLLHPYWPVWYRVSSGTWMCSVSTGQEFTVVFKLWTRAVRTMVAMHFNPAHKDIWNIRFCQNFPHFMLLLCFPIQFTGLFDEMKENFCLCAMVVLFKSPPRVPLTRKNLSNCILYTNICTNTCCKFVLNYSTCFGVNTPSSGSLQVVLAEVMDH